MICRRRRSWLGPATAPARVPTQRVPGPLRIANTNVMPQYGKQPSYLQDASFTSHFDACVQISRWWGEFGVMPAALVQLQFVA